MLAVEDKVLEHAATLHSDSVSRVGVITIPGFAYLIGNLAQRAAATGGDCAVQTLPPRR